VESGIQAKSREVEKGGKFSIIGAGTAKAVLKAKERIVSFRRRAGSSKGNEEIINYTTQRVRTRREKDGERGTMGVIAGVLPNEARRIPSG